MNKFGLNDKTLNKIIAILDQYASITKVIIFGSRARNTYTTVSDIDLAIWCNNDSESKAVISKLYREFEDSTIPYTFDLVDYMHINSDKLRHDIDTYGKVLYLKR